MLYSTEALKGIRGERYSFLIEIHKQGQNKGQAWPGLSYSLEVLFNEK